MFRRIATASLVLSMLLLAFAALPVQRVLALTATVTSTPCGGSLTITGQVYSATMQGIAGATVIADTSVSHPFSTTTAADGTYTLSIPATSNYACLVNGLRVTAPGYNEYSRVINSPALRAQPVQNFGMTAGNSTITPTRTMPPGCGTRVVVTSTPSPTFTPTPRTATATTTPSCSPIYITATPYGSTNGPDLVISSITYAGSTPACTNAPKDNIIVTNTGNVSTGTFVVSINGNEIAVTGLGAGQSITLVVSAVSSITAIADSTNLVGETNENNNTASANLPIPTQAPTCTPTGPTLTPTLTPTFTRTPTRTITKTPTCAAPTAERLLVSSVTSPSTATSQVLTVTLGHGQSVYVVSEAGSFTATGPVNGVFTVTVTLVPNSVNHLQVQGVVSYASSCPPYSLFTTVDSSGKPLTIVQGTVPNTPTPTRTPTISPTPTTGLACNPLTGTISAPFTQDGVGSFCWQTTNMGGHINSWNLIGLTINGVNYVNQYVSSGAYPPKINGYWYIRYNSTVPWGHFEAK